MAIAWIREVRNYYPNAILQIRVIDDNRHPTLDNATYGKDDWMQLNKPATPQQPATYTPNNLAVPWSYGGAQRLIIQTTVNGITKNISAEIRGRDAWDYLLLRDNELREIGEIEIGSLGDAPGINHSWWALVLHSDGKLEWQLFERQGARRQDLLNVVNQLGGFIIELAPLAIDAAAKLIPIVLAAA